MSVVDLRSSSPRGVDELNRVTSSFPVSPSRPTTGPLRRGSDHSSCLSGWMDRFQWRSWLWISMRGWTDESSNAFLGHGVWPVQFVCEWSQQGLDGSTCDRNSSSRGKQRKTSSPPPPRRIACSPHGHQIALKDRNDEDGDTYARDRSSRSWHPRLKQEHCGETTDVSICSRVRMHQGDPLSDPIEP